MSGIDPDLDEALKRFERIAAYGGRVKQSMTRKGKWSMEIPCPECKSVLSCRIKERGRKIILEMQCERVTCDIRLFE